MLRYNIIKGDKNVDKLRAKQGFICDMDGVIYHGNRLLDGALEFVNWLQESEKRFLFLTNSSKSSPKELSQKLSRMGLNVDESHFYTSALATAQFLSVQSPNCSAFVIGDSGLLNALYERGITMNDVDPDYVIVGETQNYNYDHIIKASGFINKGAKLIGTNYDLTGPTEQGMVPATRALISPIELATGKLAYFVGKPNPLIMRTGKKLLGCQSEDTVIVGDNMDTDIKAGLESGIDTVLVLSGVSAKDTPLGYAYRPDYILNGVGDIVG